MRALITPPFMHGAGHWVALRVWLGGGTVHLLDHPEHLDPADVWSIVERERIEFMLIVGDAFARPLVDELDRRRYDLSSLNVVLSGGAAAVGRPQARAARPPPDGHDRRRARLVGGRRPAVPRVDGRRRGDRLVPGARRATTCCRPTSTACCEPGDDEIGWLAKSGRLALGYLHDADKTARTYPVVDGVRYVIPGDRARLHADGSIELQGRDAVTINSGGEKIFAEEVEMAVKAHPGVYDCVVAGRPSERWGNEVVAIVRPRDGADVTEESLLTEAGRHIARYKLPKGIVFVDEIVRSPSGKADYRWARQVAAGTPDLSRRSRSCERSARWPLRIGAVGPQVAIVVRRALVAVSRARACRVATTAPVRAGDDDQREPGGHVPGRRRDVQDRAGHAGARRPRPRACWPARRSPPSRSAPSCATTRASTPRGPGTSTRRRWSSPT